MKAPPFTDAWPPFADPHVPSAPSVP